MVASRLGRRRIRPGVVFPRHRCQGSVGGSGFVLGLGFRQGPCRPSRSARHGIGEALVGRVFAAFRDRGAAHVDLKTHRVEHAAAVRLYERLGMIRVAWEG
ncbi:GNAT family N-acetyltransferase [Mesorhizobium sp. RCC_202]|uniref:GNAT family N-acetyltransferase n=1 Tax=Mesorhizobium sp. RCC_202 TaxID=3239222 RepID=UPI003525FB0D